MIVGLRESKRRAALRRLAIVHRRRLGLSTMSIAIGMARQGYGREDIAHTTGLPMARCREIVFAKREGSPS